MMDKQTGGKRLNRVKSVKFFNCVVRASVTSLLRKLPRCDHLCGWYRVDRRYREEGARAERCDNDERLSYASVYAFSLTVLRDLALLLMFSLENKRGC